MTFSDIQLELGVATCCGSCEPCARELVARFEREAVPARSDPPRPSVPHGVAHAGARSAFA